MNGQENITIIEILTTIIVIIIVNNGNDNKNKTLFIDFKKK